MFDPRLQVVIREQQQRFPLVFLSICGSQLFGFDSPDSDLDLHGAYVLPLREVIGLSEGTQTVDFLREYEGLQVDYEAHDVRKCFEFLLRKKNGNVLEAICSPLIVYTTPEHKELQALAKRCVTRYYGFHYLGFANTQLKLYSKEQPRRVKPLLYIYRVLLTGLYLMRSGHLEPNLVRLNDAFQLSYIPDLIARKRTASKQAIVESNEWVLHEAETAKFLRELELAVQESVLPEHPDAQAAEELNELLIRLRLKKS